MNFAPSSSSWLLWLRNGLILGVLAAGACWGVAELLAPPVVKTGSNPRLSKAQMEDIRRAAQAVDADFEQAWIKQQMQPVAKADDLTLMRRLSLALTGSIPSLQELRMLESQKDADGPQWWLSHLLSDRRTSDYLAERLARVYVGIENGPFLMYRRRRLVDWLSDAIQQNRPYDQIARSLIDSNGVWTTNPEVNFVTVTNENNKGPDEVKLAAKVSRAFLGVRIDCVQCLQELVTISF